MGWYGFMPDWRIMILPAFVLLVFFGLVSTRRSG